MQIKKGDYVTRNSYGNDTVFKVINISDNTYYLKGVEVRLYADANFEDLKLETDIQENEELDSIDIKDELLTRGDYFYFYERLASND